MKLEFEVFSDYIEVCETHGEVGEIECNRYRFYRDGQVRKADAFSASPISVMNFYDALSEIVSSSDFDKMQPTFNEFNWWSGDAG